MPRSKSTHFLSLFVVLTLFACSGQKEKAFKHPSYSGLYFEHGSRQGFTYTDSKGIVYNCRYFTSTVTNDSTVPIQIKIDFSKEYAYSDAVDGPKFKAFVLPEGLSTDKGKKMKKFLSSELKKPTTFHKIIKAKEEDVITIGVLSELKCPDARTLVLISKGQKYHSMNDAFIINPLIEASKPQDLSLCLVYPGATYITIPCGRILF